jgi:hypothetical protein
VGGTFDDIATLTVHGVGWTPEKMADLGAGVDRFAQATGPTR